MEKKSRILYIKRFLERQTDEKHPAALKDILAWLEKEGIRADRRAAAADIELLIEAGADIVRNTGRQYEYFCGGSCFELPELKLLIDAAQASRFIPHQKSKALTAKLAGFASRHQAGELERHLYAGAPVKANNGQAYAIVDMIHSAIGAGVQVRFKYYEYTPEKKKVYKHGGRVYELSPYGLIWNGDCYYVVGYSKHHGKVITFRVDRIAASRLTQTPAVPKPEGFDMAFYAGPVFRMYDGPLSDVTLLCENRHMKTIVDRFGEDARTHITDDEHFTAHVRVAASPTFFGWVFSFGGAIRITAPKSVVKDFGCFLNRFDEIDDS